MKLAVRHSIALNGIGLNAVAILIDMAKWTWEALMRTETTLKTESLPLRFAHVISLAGEKLKLLREHTEATCASLLITVSGLAKAGNLTTKV